MSQRYQRIALRCRTLKFENSAEFHPIKFVDGVIDAFVKRGGRFYENTPVVDQTKYNGKEVRSASCFVSTVCTPELTVAGDDLFWLHIVLCCVS